MFVWAADPEPYREPGLGRVRLHAGQEAQGGHLAGVGFGPGGEGYVRFALIENEREANNPVEGVAQNLKRTLTKLGAPQTLWGRLGPRRLPPPQKAPLTPAVKLEEERDRPRWPMRPTRLSVGSR
jgi:hypothetical protein